jgi:hypothetical protein
MSVDVETPSARQPSQNGVAIRPTSIRRWTGIFLAIGLVVMVVSGLGLFAWHDVPQAEAATGSFLGIDYEVWSHLHLISSILFTGAAASHLRLNWRPLLRHFGARSGGKGPK